MIEPNYEPWADLHAPKNFERTDKTARHIGLYTGERDWIMSRDYVLYVAAAFMLVIIAALYFGG